MLNSKFEKLRNHFGVTNPEDWQDVEPSWILAQDRVGPKTLDYLRLLLASRGLTLKNDQTPEHWKLHLSEATVVDHLGDPEEGSDRGVVLPFSVLIDTAEQQPFTFQSLRADAEHDHRPYVVPLERRCLGRHPDSLGDYSLSSGVGRCHVERKSMADAHSTILGWGDRRDRFKSELENLAKIEAGLVVVECSFGELIRCAPTLPNSTATQNAKSLERSVLSFLRKQRCQWLFCDSRRLAERATFDWLKGWHDDEMHRRKQAEREARKERQKEQAELVLEGMQ